MSEQVPTDSRSAGRVALYVALLTLAVFASSLFAGFVYDDLELIVDNRYARDLRYLGRPFTTHLWDTSFLGEGGIGLTYYRPLVVASYLVNWVAGGGSAWSFHAVNVLAHAAAVYLAVRVGTVWLGSVRLAALAAVIFAAHPTRVESVVWIAGRTDVFMGLFMLASVRYVQRASEAGRKRRVWLLAAALCGVCAVLSKELALLLPGLFLVDWLRTKPVGGQRLFAVAAASSAGVGVVYLLVRAIWLPVRTEPSVELTPVHALMTIGYYLERIVLPWPQTFFFRPLSEVDGQIRYSPPHVAVGAIALALALWLLVRLIRRDRVAALLLVLSGALMGPLLNLTDTGIFVSASDHFLYLPLWLAALCFARVLAAPLDSWLGQRSARLAAAGFCAVSAAVVGVTSLEFRDNRTLWARELDVNPDNPFVLRELAEAEASDGRLNEAAELFVRSLSPASLRFGMLAQPQSNAATYFKALQVQAALTADGDVRNLNLLCDEMVALSNGRSGTVQGRVGPLNLGWRIGDGTFAKISFVGAEAAFLASRLGRDQTARALLSRVRDTDLVQVTNRWNLVLTHARIGDFAGAKRRIGYMRRLDLLDGGQLDALSVRVRKAEELLVRAESEPEPAASELRALAMADLGAYLRALRQLRPAFERYRQSVRIASQYVQLLVAAGLVGEARATLERLMPAAEAERTLNLLVTQLNRGPRLRPVAEPSNWWSSQRAAR